MKNLRVLTLLSLSLFIASPAFAGTETFLCTLQVKRILGQKLLVDEEREIQIGADKKASVFDGVMQAITPTNAVFLVDSSFSELNIGIYNRTRDPKKLRMSASASGDAQAFAKLRSIWITGDMEVQFSCKNKNYGSGS